MTTRRKLSTDYQQLSAQFGVVRRAWKRAAALSGLAVVVTEGLGIFTGLLFLDWLYQPMPMVRMGLWIVALLGMAYFFVQNVVKPLRRKISDEQIALYIEENRTELDGVLITAAEFGRKQEQGHGSQAALIDAVVREAATRSAQTRVGGVVDFSRLKKYGIGALAGAALYLVLCTIFPTTFGTHVGRVLEPWFVTEEDKAQQTAAALKAAPLRIALSKGDTSLQRGASFDFEATLSKPKPAEQPVILYFRPRTAGTDWKKIAMTEMEKLNGFQGTLPDVSEDMEFYVACGDTKSDTHRLTVFDPLIVRSLEMTTHFPDYVKQPDRLEKPSAGDVTALEGSKATLRILTSTPLKEGQIKWSNGQTQPVTVDAQANATATVTFEVKQDDTYDYTVTDVNGQQASSAASLSVHAIPDKPPTVTVNAPQSPALTSPIGEINFDVKAGDDFGVVGLDLVYSRIDANGEPHDTRVPLPFHVAEAGATPNAVVASYRLTLEDANPPFQPDDAIPYHVEARDAKGQVVSSPTGLIIVGEFEHWATWASPELMKGLHKDAGADLLALLALVWELDNQKTQIKPEELQKRSKAIAAEIVKPDGTLNDFLDLEHHPHVARVAPQINGHISKAHDALVAIDASTALNQLSIAAAIYAGNGMKLDAVVHGNEAQEIVVGSHTHLPALNMLEQARLTALANASKAKTHDEKKQAMDPKTAAAVADLLKSQDALLVHAKALADAQNSGAPKGPQTPNGLEKTQQFGAAGGAGAGDGKQPSSADLAAQQKGAAEKARAAALDAQGRAADGDNAKQKKAADDLAATAKKMDEAARDFATGNTSAGTDKANEAKTDLEKIGASLQTTNRDDLDAAIGDAARQATLLLEKQNDLGGDTETLAKTLGTNQPDQRQQRDLQKLAYQQTVLGADSETLNQVINDLNQKAEDLGQPEAIHLLGEAQKAIKRGQPQIKMTNAVVDLNSANPGAADGEQKSAEASLQKIIESLQAGSDSLAASRGAQLGRAGRAAQDAKKGLESLLGKNPAQAKGGAQGKDDQASGEAKGKGDQTSGDAKGKGDQASGDAKGKGDQASGDAKGKSDQASGDAKGKGDQASGDAKADGGQVPGDGQGKGDQADAGGQGNGGGDDVRQLAYNLTQLTAAVDNRQLVPQDEADQLKQMTMDKAALEKRLAVDPKFLQDVSAIVTTISDKIEAEIAATSAAGKLFSSQREECPPNYRQFVNKYFEVLSQVAPAPGQATKPETPSQP